MKQNTREEDFAFMNMSYFLPVKLYLPIYIYDNRLLTAYR